MTSDSVIGTRKIITVSSSVGVRRRNAAKTTVDPRFGWYQSPVCQSGEQGVGGHFGAAERDSGGVQCLHEVPDDVARVLDAR